MNQYIATFFTHFGAVRFSRMLKEQGIDCKVMPVPRKVSSSCGSCVRFTAENESAFHTEDVEGMYIAQDDSYIQTYSSL